MAKKTIEDIKKTEAKKKKEMEETRKKMAELKARTARPPPVVYAGDAGENERKLPRCFRCEEIRHYISNCPNRLPGGIAPVHIPPTTALDQYKISVLSPKKSLKRALT